MRTVLNAPARLFAFALLALVGSRYLHAESPYDHINAETAKADVVAQPLRGEVTMLSGSGGNVAVLHQGDQNLMVDGGIAVSRDKMVAALNRLGSAQTKYLVNTHWHWDHTDGNGWIHDSGATIVGHPNARKHMMNTVRVEEWQHTFEPLPPGWLPTSLVDSSKTIQLGNESAVVKAYPPSHTDGDLSVYFTQADVLVTGDTFWNGVYPFIDYVAGGSIDGMIRAANENIARVTDKTMIVPGHGPIGARADLVEYRDMLIAIREKVAALKKQGKSVEETIAAKPTELFDAKWGNFVIDPTLFVRLVYRGV